MAVGFRVGINDAIARDCEVLDAKIDPHYVLFLIRENPGLSPGFRS